MTLTHTQYYTVFDKGDYFVGTLPENLTKKHKQRVEERRGRRVAIAIE